MSDPWYVEAFREAYLDVYPHRDLAAARLEVASLMRAGLRGRTLDLCCGWGRHSLAMREAGLAVFGVDLSADLLRRGLASAGAELLHGRLLRADARGLPFRNSSFESAVCLFSSFGYLDADGDRDVAAEIARVLCPDGVAVLDLMNARRVKQQLVPTSTKERAGMLLRERRWLTGDGNRVEKDVQISLPGGEQRSWRESVRLYEPADLPPLFEGTGMEIARIAGGFGGEPYGSSAERMVVWARKRG